MPKIVDHEKRQSELAQAAFETVCKLGIASTTMRTLAESALCSTGTLVHYFQDKDDILIAALNYAYGRCWARMQVILQPQKPRLLERFTIASLPTDKDHQEEWRVWLEFWGKAVNDSKLKKVHKSYYKDWLDGLENAIQLGIDQGELIANLNTSEEAATIAALIDGIGVHATLDVKRMPPKKQISTLKGYLNTLVVK